MIDKFYYNRETRQFGLLGDISSTLGKIDTDKLKNGLGSAKNIAGGIGKSILDNRKSISGGLGGLSTAYNLFRGKGFMKSIGSGIKTGIGARIGLGSVNKMVDSHNAAVARDNSENVTQNQNNGSGNDKGTSGNVTQNQDNGSGNKK